MKRFFLALLLLIFCFSIAIYGFHCLEKTSFQLIEMLEKAGSMIFEGETKKAENALRDIEKAWEKNRLAFNVFLDHTTLDTLDSSLPALFEIFKSGSMEQAFEEIQKSIAVLKDIVEEQKISIGNIL